MPVSPAQKTFVAERKFISEKLHVLDTKGRSNYLRFASARFLPVDYAQAPKFDLMTKSMLVQSQANGQKRSLWEGFVGSEVDNTSSLEPISDHKYSGYRFYTKENNRMKPAFIKQLKQCALKQHDQHKTEVVMNLAGYTPKEFSQYLDLPNSEEDILRQLGQLEGVGEVAQV